LQWGLGGGGDHYKGRGKGDGGGGSTPPKVVLLKKKKSEICLGAGVVNWVGKALTALGGGTKMRVQSRQRNLAKNVAILR